MNDAMKPHCLIVALLLVLAPATALAASPTLRNLIPPAGQRGQAVDVTFHGDRFTDATQVLFHTQGITHGELQAEKGKVRTTLTIAPDAPLGEHRMRIVTRSGVSEMVTFRVVDRPIVNELPEEERKPSTSFAQPQPIAMGTIVYGRTLAEDVDFYGVDLKKGQRLTVQVEGMSLGRGFTDSHLAVLDENQNVLVSCDDTPLLRQDPYVSLLAPKDGRYVIAIRDSGYQGGENNRYLMYIGSFVRPAVVFPLGGQPGEKIQLRVMGDLSGTWKQTYTLPGKVDNDFIFMPERDGMPAPTGHKLRVNGFANVMDDDDPKTDADDNGSMKLFDDRPAHDLPVAFNGTVDKPGDMDYYKVRLRKDHEVYIKCHASKFGSPLDSVINIFNAADKKHLVGNDDQGGSDSTITYKAPKDGEYFIRIRDHRNRGGELFVYRIEIQQVNPRLSASIERYNRDRPQERQAIAIPAGNRMAALVRVNRNKVAGDIAPSIPGLPKGVKFKGYGAGGQQVMPVVFEAGEDAPQGAVLVDLGAQSKPKGDSADVVRGGFRQVTPIVIANPNRTEYHFTVVNRAALAVTEPVPFKIDVAQPRGPLVRDGRLNLKVNLERIDGYEGRVQVYMLWRPPGIGATNRIEIKKGAAEGTYSIEANASTALRKWPMAVVAQCDTKQGPVWISSQLFEVAVEEPFVSGSIEKLACHQGDKTRITVDLEHLRDWKGKGELKILGLPAGCKVEPQTISPRQAKAQFALEVADNAQRGRHRSLMCELKLNINGQEVIHRFARGGQLRIDRKRDSTQAQSRLDPKE